MSEHEPWWRAFYDDTFAMLSMGHADAVEHARMLGFLWRELDLSEGSTLFDQCCGDGHVSLAMAERGVLAHGVDQAALYIERAQDKANAAGLEATFVAADAFEYVPDTPCDAAINWHTSFGYTRDDAKNAQMLERALAALRPGGRFALDVGNTGRTLRDFKPAFVTRHEHPAGEIMVTRESRVDLERGMLEQRWTYVFPDGRVVEKRGDTRLYLPHELVRMCEEVGFVDVQLRGDVCGAELTLESRRCIVLAAKSPHAIEPI